MILLTMRGFLLLSNENKQKEDIFRGFITKGVQGFCTQTVSVYLFNYSVCLFRSLSTAVSSASLKCLISLSTSVNLNTVFFSPTSPSL